METSITPEGVQAGGVLPGPEVEANRHRTGNTHKTGIFQQADLPLLNREHKIAHSLPPQPL